MRAAVAEGTVPSGKHATLVEFFRAHPELTTVLLRLGGIRLSRALVPQIVESTFPASIPDRHSDAAVAYLYGKDPKVVAVVEVQLAIDKEKPGRWLSYHVAAEVRHRCSAVVLVVTPHANVARWARRPRAVGPKGSFAPLVVGPDELPRVAQLSKAERSIELSLLAALAHRRETTHAELRSVAQALLAHKSDHARMCYDLLRATFGEALERAVEDLNMLTGEPLSDFFKKYYREGKAEGKAAGKAEALLAFLSARGLELTPGQRDVILACTSLERLDRWIARAVAVQSVAELLTE
jgi:hypothetical protein